MKERISRLVDDFNQGMRRLESLDLQRARLRDDLLRISGAIQALRDLAEESPPPSREERIKSNGL